MIEIVYYSPKRGKRWVLSIGHGSPRYGQSDIASLICEDIEDGQVVYARHLWHCGRRPNKERNADNEREDASGCH